MARDFHNGYIGNYTAGIEQTFKDVVFSASYVATAGVKLASVMSPNGYTGASPAVRAFHPVQFLRPDYGRRTVRSSSWERLPTPPITPSKFPPPRTSPRLGLGFQSSYTLGKALDDTSAVVLVYGTAAGTTVQALYENPWNPGADKGPSTFDMAQVFTTSAIQALPFDRVSFLRPLGTKLTSGWQVLNITTLTTGSPFSVYSGIQQTGVGSAGADRPDQIAAPDFSTRRTVREDYFGRGDNNASFFSIPIDVPGGTGPNQGRFGTLGRNTFRGPDFYNLDMALIKDTTLGSRARFGAHHSGVPRRVLQRLQPGQLWTAREHLARIGLRGHQSYRGDFPPDSVLAEVDLLVALLENHEVLRRERFHGPDVRQPHHFHFFGKLLHAHLMHFFNGDEGIFFSILDQDHPPA